MFNNSHLSQTLNIMDLAHPDLAKTEAIPSKFSIPFSKNNISFGAFLLILDVVCKRG
ncbi:hypothetical protein HYC85_007360 [Camellia sinensis]|uniref:Uncharacterized protein n=1 Tax=Camellia sinensis TaxID=4442 RepID=A0A7J7HR68_CAMSI|nr:hypothetical protein HYC85_007360 [Camellia sinensis]